MLVFEARASLILHNVLKTLNTEKIFLLPLNVCPIVPATFLKANICFEFVDISNETLCMDENLLYAKLNSSPKYGGVLFVKTFGVDFNSEYIFKKIKKINKDIFIIDDRCLSIPIFKDDIDESYANLILYSTGYSKFIDLGWGGFGYLGTDIEYKSFKLDFVEGDLDDLTKKFQQSLENKSKLAYSDSSWLGSDKELFFNFQEYKTTVELKIQEMKEHKNRLNSIYMNGLPDDIILGKQFSIWRFSIVVKNKLELLQHIFDNNLFASSHYASLEYMYNCKLAIDSNSKLLHDNIINLFNDFRFTQDNAKKIVKVINNFLKEN